jgi:hypothetical protein
MLIIVNLNHIYALMLGSSEMRAGPINFPKEIIKSDNLLISRPINLVI